MAAKNCGTACSPSRTIWPDHDRSWHDAAPLEIAGFDTPGYAVEDIVFKDITIQKPSVTLPFSLCRGITLSNISCAEP